MDKKVVKYIDDIIKCSFCKKISIKSGDDYPYFCGDCEEYFCKDCSTKHTQSTAGSDDENDSCDPDEVIYIKDDKKIKKGIDNIMFECQSCDTSSKFYPPLIFVVTYRHEI